MVDFDTKDDDVYKNEVGLNHQFSCRSILQTYACIQLDKVEMLDAYVLPLPYNSCKFEMGYSHRSYSHILQFQQNQIENNIHKFSYPYIHPEYGK